MKMESCIALLIQITLTQMCTGVRFVSEEYTRSGCQTVNLDCPAGSLLIVTQASFTPGPECTGNPQIEMEDNWHIWESVSRRCTGYATEPCSYNLGLELPESKSWGEGRVDIKHRCESGVSSYCGGKIDFREGGYLSSPGYPKYYLGGRECVWNLAAAAGQSVTLELLDISLQKGDCVSVVEGGEVGLEHCGDLPAPLSYSSNTSSIELRMSTGGGSQSVFPRRGVLVNYQAVGCPHPPPVADGQLLQLNKSHAKFICDDGYIFKSEFSAQKTWHCRSNVWVGETEHCVSVEFLLQYGNQTLLQALKHSHKNPHFPTHGLSVEEWSLELGATVLVGVLLILSLGVALLLFFRFKEAEALCIQEDRINLRESGSRQGLQDEIERY